MNRTKCAHELQQEILRAEQDELEERIRTVYRWSTTLSLRNSDQQKVHPDPNSRIWICRFRGVRKLPKKW